MSDQPIPPKPVAPEQPSPEGLDETPCSLLRAWKIEPPGDNRFDSLYMLDTNHWPSVMDHVEYALEQQMESNDGGGDRERPWNEMSVTITGVMLTPEKWEEISGNEY